MRKVIAYYDDWCPICTSFISKIKKLDFFNLIECKKLRALEDEINGIDLDLAKKEMATYTTKWHYGFISIYLILVRIPIFWVFIPILILLRYTGLGQILYREMAVNRKIIPIHCGDDMCNL